MRDAGEDSEALCAAFEAEGLRVTETHFGRIEDLRTDNTTNRNTDQLGYTDAAVELHTDQPFIARPPRFQMLHCMRAAEQGGENALADAREAARYLRMEAFYRAYRRFVAIVSDPAHHVRTLLASGDFLFYDNLRMLHARTGFRGSRWVRGVYFDPAPGPG